MPPNRVSNVLIWHRKLLCICGMWFWVVWHDWPMRWGSSAHVCRLSLATSMSLSIIFGIKSANYVMNILCCNFQCWFKISTCKSCGPKQYQSLVQRRYKNTSLNSMSFLSASKPEWGGHGKCIASEISIIFLAKTPEIAESFLRLLFFSFSFVFFVFCLCLLIDLFCFKFVVALGKVLPPKPQLWRFFINFFNTARGEEIAKINWELP